MPRRASQLLSLFLVAIILLADLFGGWGVLVETGAPPVAAPGGLPARANAPMLAGKQAHRQHDRKQKRRHDRQQDRKRAHQQRNAQVKRARARTGASTQQCTGPDLVPLRGLGLCTHGPDAAPAELEGNTDVAPLSEAEAAGSTQAIACDSDGQSGFRTQVLYVYDSTGSNRYAQYLASFQSWASEMDAIYRSSSMATGPVRSVRFVQDPTTCLPVITPVGISRSAIGNFSGTISTLVNMGYNRQDRIYLMFADSRVYCGIGTFGEDDSTYAENDNNIGPSYARVDSPCWSGSVAAHEVMHNLGGVQLSAPHTSGGAHCIDEYDIMCYRDSPYYPQMQVLCPNPADDDVVLDCHHDDYFNTNPAPGSYLATHWNAANNRFLTNAPPLPSAPPPPPPPPTAGPGHGKSVTRKRPKRTKHRKHRGQRNRNRR